MLQAGGPHAAAVATALAPRRRRRHRGRRCWRRAPAGPQLPPFDVTHRHVGIPHPTRLVEQNDRTRSDSQRQRQSTPRVLGDRSRTCRVRSYTGARARRGPRASARSTGPRCSSDWPTEPFDVLVDRRRDHRRRRRPRRRHPGSAHRPRRGATTSPAGRRRRAPSSSTAACATCRTATSASSTRRSTSASGCAATPRTWSSCCRS